MIIDRHAEEFSLTTCSVITQIQQLGLTICSRKFIVDFMVMHAAGQCMM